MNAFFNTCATYFNSYAHYFNTLINVMSVAILIYYIYTFFKEYKSTKEFENNNITTYSDLDTFNEQYQDTELCKFYTSLSEREKEYFYHLINANRLKYKNDKPPVTKQIKNAKNQFLNSMVVSLLVKQKLSAAFDTLKFNSLLNFMNTQI
jgi:hypothetical protein